MHRRLGGAVVVVGLVAVVLAVVLGVRAGIGADAQPVAAASAAAPGQPLRIMPLGSSSTVGAGSLATAGFRGPLETMLTADGIAFDMVGSQQSGPLWMADRDHEGHGGWTMARMQPQVAEWVAAQRPDLVLLQVGTNDLIAGTPAAIVAARLDTMLTTIHATSRTGVIVAGVWAPLRTRLAARVEYTHLAAAVVARHRSAGEPVTFVDASTLLGPGDVFDGLHPDTAGYRKIAALWEREISSYVTALQRH